VPRVRPKIDPKKVYVCQESFGTAELAGGGVRRGARLLGNHEAVQRWPQFFSPDGTPESEWPNPWRDMPAPAQDPPRPADPGADIPDFKAAVALETFLADGRTFRAGLKYRRDDPVVKANPELFGTVSRRLSEEQEVR
jgi:hypothetical protein